VILGIAHDHDTPSTGLDLVAFGDALRRVVGSLGVNFRADFANDGAHILLRKDNDGVNIFERRKNFSALSFRHYGPTLAFQCEHGSIAIHRDNQFAAEFPRSVQVAHVPDVEHIKASISQRDAIPGAPPLFNSLPQFVARNNFPMR
jgi:hypothetical protein